jgi:TldD protein
MIGDEIEAVIEAIEYIHDTLDDREIVAYAEVGGGVRDHGEVVITDDGVQSTIEHNVTEVWWRVYVDGAADYRYTTSLDTAHVDDLLDRAIRAAELLDQSDAIRFDPATVHRAIHDGWGERGSERETAIDGDADRLKRILHEVSADLPIERANLAYRADELTEFLTTTTGSWLRTTLERVGANLTLATTEGKLQRHIGTTTGCLDDRLRDELVDDAAAVNRLVSTPSTPLRTADRFDVALSPRAAGHLFHQLSHYFEKDMIFLGSSPVECGMRFGPDCLSIDDGIDPGSWAARAYDAEGRPTQATALVRDGIVTDVLTDASSALAEERPPMGAVIPAIGYEHPPRVHARHLNVAPGTTPYEELVTAADVSIERLNKGRFGNEATRTKRESGMPPSVAYAKDIARATPVEYADESASQTLEFPVELAYRSIGGTRERVCNAVLEISLKDVARLTDLSSRRETTTGTCRKHGSTLPFAVTAPGVLLSARLRPTR